MYLLLRNSLNKIILQRFRNKYIRSLPTVGTIGKTFHKN